MIWAVLLIGIALVATVGFAVILSPARAALGLLATGAIVVVAFVALAAATAERSPTIGHGFSHERLEADRIITERMATATGPGMRSLMALDGMLERSANDAYLRALESHAQQVDRMLGRVP